MGRLPLGRLLILALNPYLTMSTLNLPCTNSKRASDLLNGTLGLPLKQPFKSPTFTDSWATLRCSGRLWAAWAFQVESQYNYNGLLR